MIKPIIITILIVHFLLGCATYRADSITLLQQNFDEGIAAYQIGNYKQAFNKWLPLAKRGHTASAFRIADMYDFAQGVSQDYAQAARWYLDAARRGHGESQCRIAGRYTDGLGISRDIIESYKWSWLCFQSEDASETAKYWADIYMRAIFSVGVLSYEEIKYVEELAKSWKPKPRLRLNTDVINRK